MKLNPNDLHLTSLDQTELYDQIIKLSNNKSYLKNSEKLEEERDAINKLFYQGYLTSNQYNNMLAILFNRVLLNINDYDENFKSDELPF